MIRASILPPIFLLSLFVLSITGYARVRDCPNLQSFVDATDALTLTQLELAVRNHIQLLEEQGIPISLRASGGVDPTIYLAGVGGYKAKVVPLSHLSRLKPHIEFLLRRPSDPRRTKSERAQQFNQVLTPILGVDFGPFSAKGILVRLHNFQGGIEIRSGFRVFEDHIIRKLPAEIQSAVQQQVAELRELDSEMRGAGEAFVIKTPSVILQEGMYQLFVTLCKLWNQTQSNPADYIEIKNVHTEKGIRSALAKMGGLNVESDQGMTVYIPAGLEVLKQVTPQDRTSGFADKTRTKFFEMIIQKLPPEIQDQARERVSDIGEYDGANATRPFKFSTAAQERIYAALTGIFELWNQIQPDPANHIDIGNIRTANGMRSALTKIGIAAVSNKILNSFLSEGLQLLRAVGDKPNGFSQRTRTQFFEIAIIQKLPDTLQARARELISDIRIREDDGAMSTTTRARAAPAMRIYAAFYAICELWNAQAGLDRQIDLHVLHTNKGMKNALENMGLAEITSIDYGALEVFGVISADELQIHDRYLKKHKVPGHERLRILRNTVKIAQEGIAMKANPGN